VFDFRAKQTQSFYFDRVRLLNASIGKVAGFLKNKPAITSEITTSDYDKTTKITDRFENFQYFLMLSSKLKRHAKRHIDTYFPSEYNNNKNKNKNNNNNFILKYKLIIFRKWRKKHVHLSIQTSQIGLWFFCWSVLAPKKRYYHWETKNLLILPSLEEILVFLLHLRSISAASLLSWPGRSAGSFPEQR